MVKRKLCVLIVDDDEDLRSILKNIFLARDFHVLTAANGQEAYDITLSSTVDAIITDVRMPTMDGIELLKKVKSRSPDLPVIFLITGFTDISREEAFRLGASGFVEKPFNKDHIVKALTKALDEAFAKAATGSKTTPAEG